jgi:hypothetical protein
LFCSSEPHGRTRDIDPTPLCLPPDRPARDLNEYSGPVPLDKALAGIKWIYSDSEIAVRAGDTFY